MAGNKMGSLKKKLGLKGKTKPGEMISSMNKMKNKSLGQYASDLGSNVKKGVSLIGQTGKAFARNVIGGDAKSILGKKKLKKSNGKNKGKK